jgi:hypothetical protein
MAEIKSRAAVFGRMPARARGHPRAYCHMERRASIIGRAGR